MNLSTEPAGDKAARRLEQLDTLFAPWNRNDAPGLVVGIALAGKTLFRRGFGMSSLESATANTPKTRMRIGSVTKHFTCMLALLLAEEGKLEIDAPIRTYLPELVGPSGAPTLRQLMQHRGGIRCNADLGLICHGLAPWPVDVALHVLARQSEVNFPPGTAMIYNNAGYYLLSLAIERASGASFETQLAERLFLPLGMADSASVRSDYVIEPGIATMHVPRDDGRWQRGLFVSEDMRGEGGIVSTIDDMLRWMGHLRGPDRFGTPATWQALEAAPSGAEGASEFYALGLRVADYRGVKTIGHSGGVIGGTSQMLTVPDHALDIIIIANGATGADPSELADRVVDLVLAEHLAAPAAPVLAQDYSGFTGDWWAPESGMIYNLRDEDGTLALQVFYGPGGVTLQRGPEGSLVRPEGGVDDLTFLPDPEGLRVRFGGKTTALRRLPETPALSSAALDALTGRYFSADADATAFIARDGDRLTIRLTDGIGSNQSTLTPLNEALAYTGAFTRLIRCSLSFDRSDGAVTGFRLNSVRTRHLRFDRISAASSER